MIIGNMNILKMTFKDVVYENLTYEFAKLLGAYNQILKEENFDAIEASKFIGWIVKKEFNNEKEYLALVAKYNRLQNFI